MRKIAARNFALGALLCALVPASAAANGGKAVPGDFDGSGLADIAVTRPLGGGLSWFVRHDNGFEAHVPFGLANDVAISGDYNGDGNVEPGVIRITNGFADWFVLDESTGNAVQIPWGLQGDTFLHGHFDNDDAADLVAVRNLGGVLYWFIRGSQGTNFTEVWGLNGNSVFAADVTGDGVDELIVAGNEGGFFRWYPRTREGAVPLPAPFFGLASDTPLPPYDIDNDGIADFIVVRNVNGFNVFYIRLNNADLSVKGERSVLLGLNSDKPFIGSFFAGQDASVAVFRNNTPFASIFIDINGDPSNPLPVGFGLQNDSLVVPGITGDAVPSRLGEVCRVIYSSFPRGVLWKQSSDHSGPPREGKPAALYTNRAPNQLSCVAVYATNGEQVSGFGIYERNGKYGTRYYSGFGPQCGYPAYEESEIAQVAATLTGGNPLVYLQWQPGECIGPFDPRRRNGSL